MYVSLYDKYCDLDISEAVHISIWFLIQLITWLASSFIYQTIFFCLHLVVGIFHVPIIIIVLLPPVRHVHVDRLQTCWNIDWGWFALLYMSKNVDTNTPRHFFTTPHHSIWWQKIVKGRKMPWKRGKWNEKKS